ncbi:putative protein phosphatase 2C 65 [Forsythia ovata]|uniref:PPM-type phosphatase domain-containing protein n=1 Tax=Forsythia ovata TaxID=205694 RepID=A0ABD1SI78_9LAMI
MGACCSCQRGGNFQGFFVEENKEERQVEDDDIIFRGDGGARVRLQGSSKYVSMFTQQGKKGINQDAMTVWENFMGEKDMFLCGVFDGHGPSGHKVAHYIRDLLPAKISLLHKQPSDNNANAEEISQFRSPFFSTWKTILVKSFQEIDEELESDATIESYCSGSTSVTILKQREHLVVANLGDSRAVLCTRDDNNQLISEQLTVDLKPNLPSEAQRIRSCQGRVLAMDEEPNVFRVWMPDQDCPGLAMARAFGDFCLKDFGLISTPEVTYRKLTERDEFAVLATDGIWDVLTNNEVVKIVASAKMRSMAAKTLVERAVRAWRYKFPCAKIDDCAVVCLFFKRHRPLTKSISDLTEMSSNFMELGAYSYPSRTKTDDALETVLDWKANEGSQSRGDRLNSAANQPRKRRPRRKLDDIRE